MKLYSLRKIFFLYLLPFVLIAQGTYYNSLNPASSSFISDLETRIRSPYTRITYDAYKTTIVPNFESRDTTFSRKVITCIYSGLNYVYTPPFAWIGGAGVNADSGFSREHTWCQSWMPTVNASDFTSLPEYSDQHHLYPINQNKVNGARSNHPLGNVVALSSSYLNGKLGTDANGKVIYEPRAEHKGDAARALLYMCVRYDGIGGYTWNFNNLNINILPNFTNPESPEDLATLLAWHKLDPPNKLEVDRNTYIESIQGNRNPFIDHPEYVNYINFNDLTKLNPTYSTEPANQPTAVSISSSTSSSLTVSWTNSVTGSQAPSGYLIEIYNSNDYFIPIDGEIYSDDTNISDSKGLVNVANSATTTYTFTGLDCGTTYYVRMYSYNGTSTLRNYNIDGTIGVTSGSTTSSSPSAEPTNYPNGYDAPTITSTSITVKWTDPTGAVLPSGYLLVANNSSVFTDPVDGVTYNNDSNLSDGNAIMNVAYGAQQYTFTGLTPATNYSFKLYPYSGSGCTRNYKIASFPATLQLSHYTSGSGGATPDVVVNEYYNGGGTGVSAVSEWVELLVMTDNLNMQGMKIRDYSASGGIQNLTNPLQFSNDLMWESVRKGTFIVIFTSGLNTPIEDLDISDKKLVISSTNTTFFTGADFAIAGGSDAIEIFNAGYTHIHSLSHGSRPGFISSIPEPKANKYLYNQTLASGKAVRFVNTASVNNFNDTTKTDTTSLLITMGLPNDATQTTFVTTVLPVELNSFSATVQNSKVIIHWSTATEVNNYGFEIERRETDSWQKIGFVEGSGSTNSPKEYSFVDNNSSSGKFSYRLKQIDRDGKFEYSQEVEVNIGNAPKEFALAQNYPNPFNPTTTIQYSIPVGTDAHPFQPVSLKIYDAIGREVATLVNELKSAGYYTVTFDASKLSRQNAGGLASGMYFAKLQRGDKIQLKKMMLLK